MNEELDPTRVTVDAQALYKVLHALNGPPHYIRELMVIESLSDSLNAGKEGAIATLTREYNHWAGQFEKQTKGPE